ncbi:unnamed protein product [Arabidopsis thaliana]|uniref:Uncharacterized protein n=1 Tax=Arabidopsis thaliana TaxID=3702 RepID=A0A5S9XGZ6_ARATH|nr:unnamed protein product [Arabidopsis thaliana]
MRDGKYEGKNAGGYKGKNAGGYKGKNVTKAGGYCGKKHQKVAEDELVWKSHGKQTKVVEVTHKKKVRKALLSADDLVVDAAADMLRMGWNQTSSVIVLVTNGSSKVADMVNDGETEAARKLKGAMLLQGVCSKKRNMLILSSPLKRSVLKGEHVNKGNVLTHRGTVKGVNGGNKAPKPTFDK